MWLPVQGVLDLADRPPRGLKRRMISAFPDDPVPPVGDAVAANGELACAQEPIHIPGAVQPHGALLALEPTTRLTVVAASRNAAAFLTPSASANDVLGRPVEAVLGCEFAEALRIRLAQGRLPGEAPWQSTQHLGAGVVLDVTAHAHADLVIVEIEKATRHDESLALVAVRQLQGIIADLRGTRGELTALARIVARGVRSITGYERAIVYRFDPDWNGQAIAEDKVEDWQQSLDGLHFPASDIPAQARALYRRSLLRWVPARDASPVALEIVQPGPGSRKPRETIDLSFARLRSLSPIHLQYHRNMGVDGSMSLSILHDDQLWGLIVCHHRGPHYPSSEQRAAAATLTDAFALCIGPAEHVVTQEARRGDQAILARLLAQIAEAEQVVTALTTGEVTIADLFGATGAAVLYEDRVALLGHTPPESAIQALREWLQHRGAGGHIFSTDSLPRHFPDWADHAGVASGVLAVFLAVDRSDMLLWFRPEQARQVSWGGNPDKNEAGQTILPRQSFARWIEVRQGFALPWRSWELELAEGLRHNITDVIVRTLRHIADLNEQLRQSQKMEAVGQLTGGLAHDFNNLLTGMIGSLDLLSIRIAQGRTAELDRYINAAVTSANRAAALTHRLLAFSRRQPLDPKPTDVNRLISSMEELIRRTVGPAVQVETVMSGGLWRTLCDANQLENALLNLAINARDAMAGGGRLTIEASNARLDDAYANRHHDVAAGQYVAVSVTDTGTGMPPDVIARVFEPFFTTKPLGEGTGLGLSMVYGFAKQSSGYARVYSELGEGTTVRLYLPRFTGEDLAEPAVAAMGPSESATGERILVVDDEPIIRMLIFDVLSGQGYRVLEAGNGQQALSILKADPQIDLLVTDIGLPGGMNGRQLADEARVNHPWLKTLFITGYAENAVFGNGMLGAGMQILTKPFAMDTLTAKIRAML